MTPEEWKEVTLGDLTKESVFGPRFSSDLYSENGNVGTIRTTDLSNGGIINYQTIPYANLPHDNFNRHYLSSGDLLITRSGTCGIPCIFEQQEKPIVAGAFLIRFVLKDTVQPAYLHELLKFPRIQAEIKKMASGGVQKKLTGTNLKKLKFSLPPLPEQKKIAQILSTWDRAIETVEQLIENNQQKKKALMQQLLTGKKRFPGFDGEWKEVRLDDVLNGKKRKGKIVPTNEEVQGMAYIGSTSFEGNFGIYTDSPDAVVCSPDDILVLWDGENAGKTTTGLMGAVSSTVVRYCIDKSKANSRFITYNLLRDNYKVRAIREGSGIPHMPGDFEQWYCIALPPLNEQRKIAAVLSSTDCEIETWQQELEHLKQEKKALMQQLFTGKRRVQLCEREGKQPHA